MSLYKKIFPLILISCFLLLFAQERPVYEMLGENVNTVINTYGKPAKHDKSNQFMEMMFYKSADLQFCFVASNKSVFQTEMTKKFSNKNSAVNLFNTYVTDLSNKGMTQVDSSLLKRSFSGDNKAIDLEVFSSSSTKKYEVRVKAQQH